MLSAKLSGEFGRGFGVDNLELFRSFYLTYPPTKLCESLGNKSESLIRISDDGHSTEKSESPIRKLNLTEVAKAFPLPWTHYVHLVKRARSPEARVFYETEVSGRD